jgi:hypothetical protein
MIFNYSTKLAAPLWKRAALMGPVFEGITTEKRAEEQVNSTEVGGGCSAKTTKPDSFLPEQQTKYSQAGNCHPLKSVPIY